jgi:hypothetical protein
MDGYYGYGLKDVLLCAPLQQMAAFGKDWLQHRSLGKIYQGQWMD